MAASVDASSPSHFNKISSTISMEPPLFSPMSDRKIWNVLQNRVDTILERRELKGPNGGKTQSVREECLLLLRGFDSVSSSLSQLTSNLDTALQGARDLSKTSLTELVVYRDSKNSEGEEEEMNKPVKRKCHSDESSEDQGGPEQQKENEQSPKNGKLKRAKNLAVSMATNAASLARELKSLKSDLCFTQERCVLLEEENRRLREGFEKGMRPEEDDLVRLQLEALLAEKSRLANENANLKRENQCLNQLVEYHQLTSQDLSENYEDVIEGMCLNFSSPTANEANDDQLEAPHTPQTDIFGFSTSLDQHHCSEEQ